MIKKIPLKTKLEKIFFQEIYFNFIQLFMQESEKVKKKNIKKTLFCVVYKMFKECLGTIHHDV